MGKMKFTDTQQKTFDMLALNPKLKEKYYFTGGTALAVFYLDHRFSDDLDFFSLENISVDFISPLVNSIAREIKLTVKYTRIENTFVYEFYKGKNMELKIDFAQYPYKRLQKGIVYQGITVDSLLDIGANKIAAINNRSELKDYVDCYFILKHYSYWDLLRAYEHKFGMELDLVLFASNMLAVEKFDYLPKMKINISLHDIKQFYLQLADKIGKRITL